MKWTEQISKDMATLRTLKKGRKWQFVWDYYKLPITALFSVALLAILTLALNTGRGDTAMYAVFVNADESGDAAVLTDILEQTGMELSGKTVEVAAGYTLRHDGYTTADSGTVEVLAALFGIGDLDVFAADEAVFAAYAGQGAFLDLSLFIERDRLDLYGPYLRTDESGREVVAGLRLGEDSPLHKAGFYTGEVIVGVAANAQNLDPAVEFVKGLVEGHVPETGRSGNKTESRNSG